MSKWQPTQTAALTGAYRDKLALVKDGAHVSQSEDVLLREFTVCGKDAALLYIDGMADDVRLQRFVLHPLQAAPACPKGTALSDHLKDTVLPIGSITESSQLSALLTRVFSGDAALLCDGVDGAFILDVKGFVKRGVQQPVNESVIVGPQEGFTESLRDNVTLLRRIMRTPALISEQSSVGNRIPTRLCILYLDGVARADVVEEVRRRVGGCNVDYVSGAGMLEQLIEDSPMAMMPQVVSTERPDRAASFLLEGQVLLALENANEILAVPISLLHLFHAPDGMAMRWQYASFQRLVRMAGMLTALFMPAFFVSLTMYHSPGISLPLLTSVIEGQARVPLSLFSSTLVMLGVFNLINEAGTRVPGLMGGSLGVVSALLLGQAAVDADLVSPLLIIVVALAGLGSFAAPSYPLSIALRIEQFALVLAAGAGGYFGTLLLTFWLLLRVCGLTSLRAPYVAPLLPLRTANPDRVLRWPIWRQRLRGYIGNPNEGARTQGRMRAWDKHDKG